MNQYKVRTTYRTSFTIILSILSLFISVKGSSQSTVYTGSTMTLSAFVGDLTTRQWSVTSPQGQVISAWQTKNTQTLEWTYFATIQWNAPGPVTIILYVEGVPFKTWNFIVVCSTATSANAGADQTSSTCGVTSTTLSGNNPSIGTGSWSIVEGTGGNIENTSSRTSIFTGVAGGSYTLRWTISNGEYCASNADDVIVQFKENASIANAGNDQLICGSRPATLSGNIPTIGVGNWTIVSGTGGTFDDASSPTSAFHGNANSTYILSWMISNSPCQSSNDNVSVSFSNSFRDCSNENYIIANSVQQEGLTTLDPESFNPSVVAQTIQYFDGLGRPMQSVITQGSPSNDDIVQPVMFDGYGREPAKYLPYTSSNNGWFNGDFQSKDNVSYKTTSSPQYQFYQGSENVAVDERPYSETIFEKSVLGRPLKSYAQGQAWSTKSIEQKYLVNIHSIQSSNSGEKIIAWRIDATGMPVRCSAFSGYIESSGHFSTGQLPITQTTDEQGNAVREYTNKSGQVILKKVQAATSGTTNLNSTSYWGLTYYVYDDLGNLRYVFPPELSKLIHDNADNYAVTSTNLSDWAFQYKYDGRKRMIEKQVPGASAVYMVYDDRDRLVLTQDGNQRAASQWLFTKYDALNRPVTRGIYTSAVGIDQAAMQVIVNDYYNTLDATKTWYETFTGNTADVHGYNNKSFPKESNTDNYLMVTYYDNYKFLTLNGSSLGYKAGQFNDQEANYFPSVTGQATGAKTKIIGNGTWLKSVNYYDNKYRVLQTVMENNQGGYDISSNVYDFVGKVVRTSTSHFKSQPINWTSKVNCTLSGETLTANATSSWGAGAVSSQLLPVGADGWFEFKVVNTSVTIGGGLSDQNTSNHYNSIDYAFYMISGGALKVYENGVKMDDIGTAVIGDVLRVERASGKIFYKKNGVIVYVSAMPSTQQLMADVGFSQQNASIGSGKLSHAFSVFAQEPITTYRSFVYDHTGRLLETWHKVDDADSVLIAQNKYNEIGQLVTKGVHSKDGQTFKQQVDYRYNIRGWLTRINDANVNAVNDNGPHDLFGMNLFYNEEDTNLNNTGLFNGNISAMKWSGNLGLADISQRGYSFSYDAMNRLKSASHHEKGISNWSAASGFHENNLNYDLNGNIQTLNRNDAGGSNMDMLSYTYGGNKLLSVTDGGDKTTGFKEIASTGTDYDYDANGNMVWDRNKGGEEVTTNGSFDSGNSNWTITDTGSRLTFTNGEVRVVAGSSTSSIAQSVIEKGKAYVIVVDMERTAGTLTVAFGNGGVNFTRSFTTTGTYVFSMLAGSTNNDFRINVNLSFVGKIKSVSVKAITVVTYNHLNLPDLVTRANDKQLQYVYDATGRKLSQAVSQNGAIVKQTDYEGEFIYENDTLKFANHEEGRIVMTGTAPEYQYHLKDHLGNVRLTFTTKEETLTETATIETSNAATEQSQFVRYAEARKVQSFLFDRTNGTAPTKTTGYAQRLSGSTNEKYGLGKSISVMPGDVISAEVYAKYVDPSSINSTTFEGQALLALLAAISQGSPSVLIDGLRYSNSTATFPFPIEAGQNTASSSESGPKAYLNWLVFDRDFNFILSESGYDRISSDPKETGLDVDHERLFSPTITIKEPGYVYIYVSNEEATPLEVYFDDFKVVHIKSPVIQTDDYYPFGLTFNSYSRENSTANNYLYNGKEKQDELDLGWMDYGARMYMPELGRWATPDPLSDRYYKFSPYVYVGNVPTVAIDPDGKKILFVNGYWNSWVGGIIGSGTPGKGYWGSGFTAAAQGFFGDYSKVSESNYIDGSSWFGGDSSGGGREEDGYDYAKKNYCSLIEGLEEDETFKLVTHSEGGAFGAGIARYLIEKGHKVESILHLSPDEGDEFETPEEPTTYELSYGGDMVTGNKEISKGVDVSGIVDKYSTKSDKAQYSHGSTKSAGVFKDVKALLVAAASGATGVKVTETKSGVKFEFIRDNRKKNEKK